MHSEPDEYCAYFNDLVYGFTLRNFRIHGFSLIKKLSNEYIDISNFVLSYFIGLFNDIMNKDNCQFDNNNSINLMLIIFINHKIFYSINLVKK